MHYWGDDWFQKNGETFYQIIDTVQQKLIDSEIYISIKEKWGTIYEECYDTSWLQDENKINKYNQIYQDVCKKYPEFVDEIISNLDYYEFIKPSKGNFINGIDIHKKHWKEMKLEK